MMKIRGLLIGLILVVVLIYFLWFGRTGKESMIEQEVHALVKTRVVLTKTNMTTVERGIDLFMGNEGRAPNDLKEILASRTVPTAGAVDGWGNTLRYERISDSSYRLISAGQDQKFDTPDDIVVTR